MVEPAALEETKVKEPGLDNRYRDKDRPKSGEIRQKRADTLNKNLSQPIPQFSPDATLKSMRAKTGRTSLKDVRKAAAKRQSK
jgi:hypothetical protein